MTGDVSAAGPTPQVGPFRTADELLALMIDRRNSADLDTWRVDGIDEPGGERLVIRGSFNQAGRPGGIVPGPSQMAMSDCFAWMLTLARLPRGSDAFTIDMAMQFLRPLPVGSFTAECDLVRRGRRRCVTTIRFLSGGGQVCTLATVAFVPQPPAAAPG